MVFFLLSSFINDRHEELVSEGGVYANMWLHQQKAEDKETDNSNTDSLEEESGLIWTQNWNMKNCLKTLSWQKQKETLGLGKI
mgnify:CR=1 FL=1